MNDQLIFFRDTVYKIRSTRSGTFSYGLQQLSSFTFFFFEMSIRVLLGSVDMQGTKARLLPISKVKDEVLAIFAFSVVSSNSHMDDQLNFPGTSCQHSLMIAMKCSSLFLLSGSFGHQSVNVTGRIREGSPFQTHLESLRLGCSLKPEVHT